ncbi:MAG: aminotransferase class IV [Eubacteriales bacterium]|nr:aminotransferase class IV [Eubacteriales bacterium]
MIFEDDGYYFGLGAFETIAVEDGHPVFLDEHLQRLQRAMDFFSLDTTLEEIKLRLRETLAQPEIASGHMVLKITVSPKNLLLRYRKNPYTEVDYANGFIVGFSDILRNETSPLTYHKTLNYSDCLMEKRRFLKKGLQEPIFLNTKGYLCEGATTNLFFVKDGQLYTPDLSCGLLPGIMRDYLCKTYSVHTCELLPEDLSTFDEMFLTNSLLGIMPVRDFQGYRQFSSGKTADRLLEVYRGFTAFS